MSLLTDLYTRVVELTNRLNAIGANSKVTEEMPLMSPVDRSALIRLSKNGTSYKSTLNDLIDEIEIQDGVVQIGVIEIIDHLGGKALKIAELPNPKWRINGLIYTKTSETIIPIPFASTDKHRIDIFVGNEFSEIQRIEGVEDDNVGIPPAIPENTVEITRINIFGETIENPELPSEVGYITKSSKKYRGVVLSDIPPKTLLLSAEYTTFNVKNSAGSGEINGFISFVSPSGTGIHDGLDIYIRNNSEPTITLLHDDSNVLVPFYFSDEQDLSIGFNKIAHLKYNKNLERVELVGIMGATFDPSNYDLDEFQNASADPFVRESDIENPTWQEVIDASVVGDFVEVTFPSGVIVSDENEVLKEFRLEAFDGSQIAFLTHGNVASTSYILLRDGLILLALKGSTGTEGQIPIQGADGGLEWGDLPTPTDPSTGLEAIDEGNGIGWRLKGRNPNNYGNIGLNAIDLGASNSASTTVGATGSNSTVGGGIQNEASGYASTVGGGSQNKSSGSESTVGGGNINVASGTQSTIGGGYLNEASAQRSTVGGGMYNKASGNRSTVGGGHLNEASGAYSTVSGGSDNLAKTFGEFLGGLFATIKEGNATTWIGTDRIFGIGNGTSASSRSDAFNVYKNGVAELPSITNSLIDAAGAKTIPTKEWVQEQGIDLSTGLEAIDEGNGIGWRLKGRNPDNYGNIGEGAIDLGDSDSPSETKGATGYASAVGGGVDNEASGNRSTVGGGSNNEASGQNSTVGGGDYNVASGGMSTVGGGGSNKAIGSYSTVGGGQLNEASGFSSGVGGGLYNIAKSLGEFLTGLYATIKEGGATAWIGTDRIFGIGNGTSESERSDAFNVYKNGLAELPSVTNALIDLADGKAITTKGWVNSRNSIILVITPLGEVLEIGDVEYTFTAPHDLILTNYWISAQVAPIGSGITVRLKLNGTYIDSTGTTIPTGDYDSLTSLPTITTPTIVKGDRITAEITAVGSTYEGEGLTLYLEQ